MLQCSNAPMLHCSSLNSCHIGVVVWRKSACKLSQNWKHILKIWNLANWRNSKACRISLNMGWLSLHSFFSFSIFTTMLTPPVMQHLLAVLGKISHKTRADFKPSPAISHAAQTVICCEAHFQKTATNPRFCSLGEVGMAIFRLQGSDAQLPSHVTPIRKQYSKDWFP